MKQSKTLLRACALLALCVPLIGLAAGNKPDSTPAPFGHSCTVQNGVRFCPTRALTGRVPSFDGVPLDVDVTLPEEGGGPFPTLVMLHGYGGGKNDFITQSVTGNGTTTNHYNNLWYAKRGYAVVNLSARGFHRSCGTPDARTLPECAAGWLHFADQRYEVRDVQYLLGLLVDQGIAKPDALGVTGISYGGGQSMTLAFLKNRIRRRDGSFAPWRSPQGRPLSLAAAFPRWGWSDLLYAAAPNGRFVSDRIAAPTDSADPFGVFKASFVGGLYASGLTAAYYAPPGVDASADITRWVATGLKGEPYADANAQAIAKEFRRFHQAFGLPVSRSQPPAPLLIQNGWTDDILPPEQAIRIYRWLGAQVPDAPVALQLGDLGHLRAANKADVELYFNNQASRFFDHYLKGGSAAVPGGTVTAFTQTCPADAPAQGPFQAHSLAGLHDNTVSFGSAAAQTVVGLTGDQLAATQVDPVLSEGSCQTVAATDLPGAAVYSMSVDAPFTLLGLPRVTANVQAVGDFGQLDARLWDVAPGGEQRLISRGPYRLTAFQSGRIRFQLHGNGYTFQKGHTVKLELAGSDAPYLRPSNDAFTVTVSDVDIELPAVTE